MIILDFIYKYSSHIAAVVVILATIVLVTSIFFVENKDSKVEVDQATEIVTDEANL